jgi:hypothetical protein
VLGPTFDGASFKTFEELGIQVGVGKTCQSRGLSVFRDIRDAKHYAERHPASGKFIARAELNATDGHLKPTPSGGNSHNTWWCFETVIRHQKFELVE